VKARLEEYVSTYVGIELIARAIETQDEGALRMAGGDPSTMLVPPSSGTGTLWLVDSAICGQL
jgi:hypothetical protein